MIAIDIGMADECVVAAFSRDIGCADRTRSQLVICLVNNRLIVQSADLAARAHFDIARIRELETALIEREFAFVESGEVQVRGALDLDGLAEGVRRVLPQLVKLSRYARRAANMGDRALLSITNQSLI